MGARERAANGRRLSDPSIVRVRAVIASGVAALETRRQEVNDLDALSGTAADGDTGDNMIGTLRAVLAELDRLSRASEGGTIDGIGRAEIVASVARAALLGARGNSGVILSQLVRGAAEELASRPGELIDPVLIGAALARAADQAYGSVREPVEGTILTAVRELAHRVTAEIALHPESRLRPDATALEQDLVIAAVLRPALASAWETLGESLGTAPDRPRALRSAQVRDPGGYGILVLVEGIVAALCGEASAARR